MGIRKWFLKSIPLKYFLKEWCQVRDLQIIEETHFNDKIKKLFETLKIGVYPAHTLLSDYKNYKTILIAKKEKISDNLIQDYLNELQTFILELGRKKEEFYFFNIKKEFLEYWNESGLYPLFFVLWKTEKPILERILSGDSDTLPFEKNEKYIIEVQENFYSSHSETLKSSQPYIFSKIIQKKSKNDKVYKYYIRRINDRYILFMLYMDYNHFRLDYLKSLIDFFVYAERPVLKLEEALKYDTNLNKSIILIELKLDGLWKGIFFNCQSLFYRQQQKKVIVLPDYSISKKYIKLSQFRIQDNLILLPSIKKIQIRKRNLDFDEILKELKQQDFGKSIMIKYTVSDINK